MGLDELIKACKRNDRRAQERIYKMYASKMYALCLKYSRSKEEAEDNLQDGFITVFEKIDQFGFKGSFEGWIKRIMINTALQKYRERNVLNLVREEDISGMVEVDEQATSLPLDYLLDKIQHLPNQYRLVFNLYVLDGYSHKEVARMLGISEGTSKSNLSRARNLLRKRIEEDMTGNQSIAFE